MPALVTAPMTQALLHVELLLRRCEVGIAGGSFGGKAGEAALGRRKGDLRSWFSKVLANPGELWHFGGREPRGSDLYAPSTKGPHSVEVLFAAEPPMKLAV